MSKSLNYISLFLAQILLSTAQIGKVNVTVYYETLCPYAKSFVVDQLHPVLQTNLSRYINLDMIPYGKANTTRDANGELIFSCHHKQVECYGNQIQACALTTINSGRNTDNLGYNSETVDFIACFMKDLSPESSQADVDAALNRCTDNKTALLVRNCTRMDFGSLYLAKLGNQTKSALGGAVFSEEYKKEESDLAELDFINAICAKIQGERPAVCRKNGCGGPSGPDRGLLWLAVALAGCCRFFWASLG